MGQKANSSSIDAFQNDSNNAASSNAFSHLTFAEVLEDLSSRFIVNLPAEELSSIERICFQVEQAHWFYEDFLRPLNPSLTSFSLRKFSSYLLHTSSLTVPLIRRYVKTTSSGASNTQDLEAAYDDFLKYKTRVPVCGVVMLNASLDKCVLVKGWKSSAAWGFPKGKINQQESERDCAVREVLEETGYDCGSLLPSESSDFMELTMREQKIRLYIVSNVDESTHFETLTRKEISRIAWFKLSDLPTWKKNKAPPQGMGGKFYLVSPFVGKLKLWIQQKKSVGETPSGSITLETIDLGRANIERENDVVGRSDELKKLLGLGNGEGMARGPQLIEEQGDARSRELLDLLRGDIQADERSGSTISSPPHVTDEREKGTAALLQALNAGAGKGSQIKTTQDKNSSAILLNMLKGPKGNSSANSGVQNQSKSLQRLSEPVPQNKSQAQNLLNLISPNHAITQFPPSDELNKEKERAKQRDALLSNLMSSSNMMTPHAPLAQGPLPASSSGELDILSLLHPQESRAIPEPAQSPFSSFVQRAKQTTQSPAQSSQIGDSADLLNLLNSRPTHTHTIPPPSLQSPPFPMSPSNLATNTMQGPPLPYHLPSYHFNMASYPQGGLQPLPSGHVYPGPSPPSSSSGASFCNGPAPHRPSYSSQHQLPNQS